MAANRRPGRRTVGVVTALAAVTPAAGLLTGCEDDDLNDAIKDCNKAIRDGDTNPDSGRIDAAADELTDVCTS